MKTWVRKSLKVGILSAGFLLIGGAAANAASTADNFGVLGGNQVQAPIQAPISVTGNAIGLLGSASATSHGGASGTAGGAAAAGSTSDNFGIGSGNQAGVSLLAPVSVAGNAIGGLGSANATATGSGAGSAMLSPNATGTSSGNFGILGGNQVHAPVQVPISITGNSIGLLGTASAASHGANGATAGGGAGAGAAGGTSDNFGIGSGNQVIPVLLIPIEVCGNGIAVLGTGDAACGAGAGNAGYGTGTGNGGYGTGTGTGTGGYGTGTGTGGYGTGTGTGGYGTGTGNGGYGTGTGTGGYTTGTGAGTMTGATTLTNLAGGGGAANVAGARQHKAKAHAQHKATKAAKADASNESADVRSAQRMSAQSSAGTSRNFGILGGTQGDLLIQTPVNVTHDALGLLGTAAV